MNKFYYNDDLVLFLGALPLGDSLESSNIGHKMLMKNGKWGGEAVRAWERSNKVVLIPYKRCQILAVLDCRQKAPKKQ